MTAQGDDCAECGAPMDLRQTAILTAGGRGWRCRRCQVGAGPAATRARVPLSPPERAQAARELAGRAVVVAGCALAVLALALGSGYKVHRPRAEQPTATAP